MTRNNEIFMSGTSFGLRIIKNLSNIGQFIEIKQDNQSIFFHPGAKQISTNQILIFSGHLGVIQHTEAKKFGIGLNFI